MKQTCLATDLEGFGQANSVVFLLGNLIIVTIQD